MYIVQTIYKNLNRKDKKLIYNQYYEKNEKYVKQTVPVQFSISGYVHNTAHYLMKILFFGKSCIIKHFSKRRIEKQEMPCLPS